MTLKCLAMCWASLSAHTLALDKNPIRVLYIESMLSITAVLSP